MITVILLVSSLWTVACYYTNLWAVHVEGGERRARQIAENHGFSYAGEIMTDYYHFQHRFTSKRSTHQSNSHHETLAKDPGVKWLEQQVVKKRRRDNFQDILASRTKYSTHSHHSRYKRDADQLFNDPKWPDMWYLNRGQGLDMNVEPAWRNGYTGRGVVVSVLDDGIERDHPDLVKNYDPRASYDFNDNDTDPIPRYGYNNQNRHGTRCAGVIAAQSNNSICGVGIAYGASIGGIRMLDGAVTDSIEAQSLSFSSQHIDIYVVGWGPDDDGRTVDGPAKLAKTAIAEGITNGRSGKGSIYVWASGNGGRDNDDCNCDGYSNSIYTVSISSTTKNGNVPWFSEHCSSILATAYSSGTTASEGPIITTDLRKGCTDSHTGNTGSSSIVAGICALTLQANPHLTWRDMQHIIVRTARPSNLRAHDWITNGAGRNVSHWFGYGLMDAAAMTEMARHWKTVPAQRSCQVYCIDMRNGTIPLNGRITYNLTTDGCMNTTNRIKHIEHVQAKITLSSFRRGEISIYLISPSGTRSTLLAKRHRDYSRTGFKDWAFMTTHFWDESAEGVWTIEIRNGAGGIGTAQLHDLTLIYLGTSSTIVSAARSGDSCASISLLIFSIFMSIWQIDANFLIW